MNEDEYLCLNKIEQQINQLSLEKLLNIRFNINKTVEVLKSHNDVLYLEYVRVLIDDEIIDRMTSDGQPLDKIMDIIKNLQNQLLF